MNLLYINPDPPSIYRYYSDLYRELRKIANCNGDKADVVIYGLRWLCSDREDIITNKPRICFVHKIGLDWIRKEKFLRQCDVVLSSVPKLPIEHTLFKYGVDPKVFYPRGEKVFDFGFTGALHSEPNRDQSAFPIPHFRREVQALARTQKDLSLYLTGSDDVNKCRIMDYEKYAEILSQSKIWLATTGPDGDIGPRYYEVMASGTLLFCDIPPEEYQGTFRDGDNCVWFTLDNFIEKLRYYLEQEDERNKIIETAYRESANHTWDKRALELIDICKRLCGSRDTQVPAKQR